MLTTDLIAITIALVAQAALITVLAIQNARLQRALRELTDSRARWRRVANQLRTNIDISDWSK